MKAIGMAVALVAAAAGLAALLPVAEWGDVFEDWLEGLDLGAGLFFFSIVYFAATLLLVPAWIFPIAAGVIFGFGWGAFIAITTATASAMVAFLASRHLIRERVRRIAQRYPAFAAVEHCVATDGWRVIALMRVSPLVPFGVKNYLLGATRVRLRDYAIGTLVGMLPAMLLKVYVGSAGRAAFGDEGGAMKWALFAAGVAATLGATYLVGRRAKARLKLT